LSAWISQAFDLHQSRPANTRECCAISGQQIREDDMDRYTDNLVVGCRIAISVARRLGLSSFVLLVGLGSARADSLADCSQARNADLRLRA
jgi:hypothetical protein